MLIFGASMLKSSTSVRRGKTVSPLLQQKHIPVCRGSVILITAARAGCCDNAVQIQTLDS
jgi:hypothetical protein